MLFNIVIILSIIIFVSTENPDNCPDLEISVNALGTGCSKITDVLENSLFEMDYSDLRYMTTKSPIEKNNYKLEITNLDNTNIQVKSKSSLYIPESCMKAMKEHEKIKLDTSKGIVIIVTNKNLYNKNNIPEFFFVIRHEGEGSEIKFMNSKSFDFSFCHSDPILLNRTVDINSLKYNENDNTPINIDRILYAKKLKVDLFDPHSDFLNNICFKFTSEVNTDVTMETRLSDYYQNITLCDEKSSSHYMEFNYFKQSHTLTYICAYGFYENIEEKQSYVDDIDSKMNMVFSNSNLKVITCFKELFNLRNLGHNYGGFICIFVFIFQIILFLDYICKGAKPLQDKIDKLFEEAKIPIKIGENNKNEKNETPANSADRLEKKIPMESTDIPIKETEKQESEIEIKLKKKKKKRKKKLSSEPPKKKKKKGKKENKIIIEDYDENEENENQKDTSANKEDNTNEKDEIFEIKFSTKKCD